WHREDRRPGVLSGIAGGAALASALGAHRTRDAVARVWTSIQPSKGNSFSAAEADAELLTVDQLQGLLDAREVSLGVVQHGCRLRAFERERRTLRIVLVIGRDILP